MVANEGFRRSYRSAAVAVSQRLIKASIDERRASWFEALNRYLPVERLLPMLANEHYDMRFLGVAIDGHSNFEPSYDVLARSFHERHAVLANTARIDARAGLSSQRAPSWAGKRAGGRRPRTRWFRSSGLDVLRASWACSRTTYTALRVQPSARRAGSGVPPGLADVVAPAQAAAACTVQRRAWPRPGRALLDLRR